MGIRTPIVLNNKGLHLALPLIPKGHQKEFQAILGCRDETKSSSKQAAIRLMDISMRGGRYKRFMFDKLEMVDLDLIQQFMYQQVCAQSEDFQLSSLLSDCRDPYRMGWSKPIIVIFLPACFFLFIFILLLAIILLAVN
jgi:hypothetical protein